MRPLRWIAPAVVAIAGLALGGCGHRAAKPNAAAATAPARFPDWAPKHPSAEFLRAWRALKPVPIEELLKMAHGDKAGEAALLKSCRFWPASYEFFGTLSDKQIAEFRAKKVIRLRPQDMTRRQRTALNAWFTTYRDVMQGADPTMSDYLVLLYKLGAKEDLSNVRAGFVANRGHLVHIAFWVTPPGGEEIGPLASWFAEI